MMQKQYQSTFVRRAIKQGWLNDREVSLLDVGASGGIDPFWNQFRPHLRATGFDPLVSEVDRLNTVEGDPKIQYVSAWVGDGTRRDPPGGKTLHSFTSAQRAADLKRMSYTQTYFNSGQELVFTDRLMTVDEFVGEGDLSSFDTLKIDTDGFDYFVLQGAKRLLNEGQLLLVECECQLHEHVGVRWPVFADIDRTMRDAGYRLIDFDPWHYTRGTLPGQFYYDIPAQTVGGQIGFCDALYALDLSVDGTALARLSQSPDKLLKAVLLQAAYGYPDLAASTLIAIREAGLVPPGIDVDGALDWLVPNNPFGAKTYRSYIETFEQDPDQFFRGAWERRDRLARAGGGTNTRPGTTSSGQLPVAADIECGDWLGHMNAGIAGTREGAGIQSISGQAGHMAYGPYAHLPTGSYEVTIDFLCDGAPGSAISPGADVIQPEINIEVVHGKDILARLRLKGEHVATSSRSLMFEIGPQHLERAEQRGVEVRVYSNGVRDVRIARLVCRQAEPAWEILGEKVAFDAPPYLSVTRQRVRTDSGVEIDDYWQVRLPDFAIAVAVTDKNEIITLWQYKHGARRHGLTFPAGHINPGEDAATAMRRELLEETGYETGAVTPLGRCAVSGNQGCGEAHLFLLTGCRRVAEPDAGDLETMEVRLLDLEAVERAIQCGDIAVLPHLAVWAAARRHLA